MAKKKMLPIVNGDPRELGLRLVPAEVGHAEAILRVLDPNSARNLQMFAEGKAPGLERQRAYLRRMVDSASDYFLLIEGAGGQLLGTIALHEVDMHHRNARFGILIFDRNERGKGKGSAAINLLLHFAFLELRLHKVYGKVFTTNDAALSNYVRLGFHPEGVLRQEYLLRGKYHDMKFISILRKEWQAKMAEKARQHGPTKRR